MNDEGRRERGTGRDSPIARVERAIATGEWREAARPSGGPPRPPGQQALRRLRRRRILALSFLVFLLAAVTGVGYLSWSVHRGELTVLVLGLDETSHHLADTILLVRADLSKGQIAALSIPRDTLVRGADGHLHKANSVVTQSGGPKQLLQQLHLVSPTVVVKVTPEFLAGVVDAAGGVELDVGPTPLNYFDRAGKWHLHLPAGKHRLTGEQAFLFSRYRKSRPGPCPFCGGEWARPRPQPMTDLMRVTRQQQLARALAAKLGHPSQWWRVPRVALSASGTGLSAWQGLALVSCARRDQHPELATYPTRVAGSRLLPLSESVGDRLQGRVAELIVNRVLVKNGTGSPGLGARVATLLRRKGFSVAEPTNAPRTARTAIEGPAAMATSVRDALGYGACRSSGSKDVSVTLGLDAQNPE